MTVNEIIKLLDKEENKFGGATGKERELNLSVNGDFIGTITNAKLDGWGDGLVTDVTLGVEVDSIKYHDDEIRAKAIDEFAEKLANDVETFEGIINGIRADLLTLDYFSEFVFEIAEQMKGSGIDE